MVKKSNLNPVAPKASEEELQTALLARGNTLEKCMEAILPSTELRERTRICKVIEMTADAIPWRKISTETKTGWIEMASLARNPSFRELWHAARDAGEFLRKELRESEAHERAVEGWDEPVYQRGAQVGSIRRFDNRLLEFLLKADNPGKYREQSQVNIQNNVVSTVVEFHRRRPVVDAPPVVVDSPIVNSSSENSDIAKE